LSPTTPRFLLSSPTSPKSLPRWVLSFKNFVRRESYWHCPSIITRKVTLLSSSFGNPHSKSFSFPPLWWSCCPDCKFCVGLIVTAYQLLSHRYPCCLRCSTPHGIEPPPLL
jgi:hypothetical protein